MKNRVLTQEIMDLFRQHLYREERSPATIEKYSRDVRCFKFFADGREK